MKQLLKKTEEELASAADRYFQSKAWSTYPEVVTPIFNGRPDLVCIKQQLVMVAEVKVSLTYPVIEQLTRWRHEMQKATTSAFQDETNKAIPHLLYAVVGKAGRLSDLKHEILKQHRIGVLEITAEATPEWAMEYHQRDSRIDTFGYSYFEGCRWRFNELLPARIQHGSRQTAHRIIEHLNPDMRCGSAGASGRKGGHMTPFRRTMNKVVEIINSKGELHISYIVEELNDRMGGHHYTSDKVASAQIAKFLVKLDLAKRIDSSRPIFAPK
ncbi:hypothetical protein [Reinekea sp. G2M2-21]|uniref:hypothetical protein n=1 Tax=Reinekea sp. G2M2-21 TaxID=2788942 RepID=UPI0018AC621A|nr:hypothetical protein [Reinekea sp. G2M2-21]